MLRFLGNMLSTILGVFISFFLVTIILIGIVASQSSEPSPYVRDNTVLKIKLSGSLADRAVEDPFEELMNEGSKPLSLLQFDKAISNAKKDERIRGIWLDLSFISSSWANLYEVREMLIDFKETGKFIYAYTDDMGFSETGYYLATTADSIFSPPETFMEFDGFYVQGEFYKDLFDKIGVKPEITRYGKYKSAIEPYIRTSFSSASKEQLNELLDTNLDEFLSAISESRGLTKAQINKLMNNPPTMGVASRIEDKLIDSLLYPDEFENFLKKRMGVKESRKLNKTSLQTYAKVKLDDENDAKNKVAIVYADGVIMPSMGGPFQDDGTISATKFNKAMDKALDSKSVKAVVIRINSPGGSGTTADLMWKKIKEVAKKKPVIASMGGVAASGGYYIAVAADTILADPTTITGSIGVFSTKFNLETLAEDKVGVTYDEIKTHRHADWLNPFHGFSKVEDNAFQATVNQFYEVFLDRVDEGRPQLTREEIHELAQGRVWSGKDALDNGLVDQLGSLNDAIALAAEKANVDEYQIVRYPVKKSVIEKLLNTPSQTVANLLNPSLVPGSKAYFEIMQQLQHKQRRRMIHALLPVDIQIH